jgi:hypothetical protein
MTPTVVAADVFALRARALGPVTPGSASIDPPRGVLWPNDVVAASDCRGSFVV